MSVISSRTPEGSPNCCPVCGSLVRVEPSRPFGDAPCPACGTPLWFIAAGPEPRFFVPDEALVRWIADQFGVSAEVVRAGRWEEVGIDSLDWAVLVMELEDQVGQTPGSAG